MAPGSITSKASTEKRNGQPQHGERERAKKRVKLSDEAYGSITTRQTRDPEAALEVDHMILDYLTYQAIETCLAHKNRNLPHRNLQPSPVDHALLQVDEFFHLFRSRHSDYVPDQELRFRQVLLQLVTLVTQRLVYNSSTPAESALQTLRSKNQERARHWIGDISRLPTVQYDMTAFDSQLPVPVEELALNREHVLKKLGVAAEDGREAFYGTKDCVSLLDLLPLFMRVSAVCHSMWDSGLATRWMQLAAEWMLQACLEQYLVFGSTGSDAMDEAFAWGYEKKETREMYNGPEGKRVPSDDPFDSAYDEEKAENWEQIRDHCLARLIPGEREAGEPRAELVPRLLEVSFDHPVADIEGSIMEFLQGLAKCIPEPVLTQLEKGQLDGMTQEETRRFMKEDCGLDMSKLFLG